MVAAAIGGQREGREVKGVYETKNDKDRRMTLPKRAKLEKEKGKQHLSVPMNSGDYVGVENLEQAGNLYTAVIAEPVQVTSVLESDEESIGSWYKFKIIETLSEPAPRPYPFTAAAPPEALPLTEDEFIAYLPGGTLTIDGVTVKNYHPDTPPLTLFKKHLLFIELDKTSRVARVSLGPDAIFSVDAQSLVPINKTSRHRRELEARYSSSYEKLKAAIKSGSAPK